MQANIIRGLVSQQLGWMSHCLGIKFQGKEGRNQRGIRCWGSVVMMLGFENFFLPYLLNTSPTIYLLPFSVSIIMIFS